MGRHTISVARRIGYQSLVIGILLLHLTKSCTYNCTIVETDQTIEYRLFFADFHFSSLIFINASKSLILRPHPGRDPNGWGSSLYIAPFLSGGADSGGVQEHSIKESDNGIAIQANGIVNSPDSNGSFGTWMFSISLNYDSETEAIGSSLGTLSITLDAQLNKAGRDLNLCRLASNYLHDVPLQSNQTGDTGDIKEVKVAYSKKPDPRDFTWIPPKSPGHFPTDQTGFLSINATGTVNQVDTQALGEGFQIKVAVKPSMNVTLVAEEPFYPMSAGMLWDQSEATNFAADNVGVFPLVLQNNSNMTSLVFDVRFSADSPDAASTLPTPTTSGAMKMLKTKVLVALVSKAWIVFLW